MRAQTPSPAQSDETAIAEIVGLLRRLVYAPDSITQQTRIADLGLDSLDLMEAGLELEAITGRELPEADLSRAETVGDIARAFAAGNRPGLSLAA